MLLLSGNHTVAVIKGKESYEIIQSSCARIFSDVNKIVESGFIKLGENRVPVEIFLGGDYKVISICICWQIIIKYVLVNNY